MSAGTVISGETVSVTTTTNERVVVPNAFDALQLTLVVPIGKNEPEVRVQLAPPSSNVTMPPLASVASPTTISGNEICGGAPLAVRSATLKVIGPIVLTPAVSVASMVTAYWPAVIATAVGSHTSSADDEALLGRFSARSGPAKTTFVETVPSRLLPTILTKLSWLSNT